MNNKTWRYIGVCVVVVALVVWAVSRNRGWMESVESPTPTSSASPTASQKAATKSYQDALVTYANVRFQFDQYCQANPQNMSVKSGRTIMLDNRSGDARVIKVGGTAYSLAGYGWRLVKVTATTFPKTLYLDCGSAVNVGTIILSK